jgi:hypothetical protein
MKKFDVTAYAVVSFIVEADSEQGARERVLGYYRDFDIAANAWEGVEESGGTIQEITQVEEVK